VNESAAEQVIQVRTDVRTKNFDDRVIPVEFVVVHYTACSARRTFDILCDESRKASAHLVIDVDGTVFELVPCLDGAPKRAWHSGKSEWTDANNRTWSAFNDFSIGIELVNENGNLFPFTKQQYESLAVVLNVLKQQHPALSNPDRVIGHEQIAGFRGKSDPGEQFDWNHVWSSVYAGNTPPHYQPRMPKELVEAFRVVSCHAPSEADARDNFFCSLSELMERIEFK
jgi:N-acetyl-anhydromuramyl-L-alanine amidase AmpD